MALALSSTTSSTFEPMRKNRWVMQFTNIPGTTIADQEETLAFAAHTAARPQITYNVIEHQRLNERFYIAGKPTWNELPMTFFDFIGGATSVSSILSGWSEAIYDPVTGAMGFKKTYTTSGTLAMLDPAGGIVQTWNMFYIWPYTVGWGELSSEDDGVAEVSATFRYDYAVKGDDTDTATDAASD